MSSKNYIRLNDKSAGVDVTVYDIECQVANWSERAGPIIHDVGASGQPPQNERVANGISCIKISLSLDSYGSLHAVRASTHDLKGFRGRVLNFRWGLLDLKFYRIGRQNRKLEG